MPRDDWEPTTLGAVAVTNPEAVDKKQPPEQIRYIDIAAVSVNGISAAGVRDIPYSEAPSRAQRIVRRGDVIVSTVRPYLRAGAPITDEFDGCVASTGFAVLRARDDLIRPEFLWLLATTDEFYAHLEARQNGGLYPAVRPGDVADAPILLPPTEEQARIADLVGAVDHALSAARAVAHSARSALTALREEALDAVVELTELGTLLEGIDAGRSPRAEARPPVAGERGVIKVSAVRPGLFDAGEAKALDASVAMPGVALIQRGDLLITRANTSELVAAVCRVDDDVSDLFLSDKTLRLRPNLKLVDPDFLVHALASTDVRRQISIAATGTSASMKNITQDSIRRLAIPVPKELDEQRAIAGSLGDFERAARAADRQASALAELRHALLLDLLTARANIPSSYDRVLCG